jgi:predicted transcriptional regulator
MGIQELRNKYGYTTVRGRTAINRAVREELISGAEVIEAEFLINDFLSKNELTADQTETLKKIQSKIGTAARIFRDEIIKRYEINNKKK